MSLTHPVYVCPNCGVEYIKPGQCGRNFPFECREELTEEQVVSDDAVDIALRAFHDWPADHIIEGSSRDDITWVSLRRALGAVVDPEGFAAQSKWRNRYGRQ